MSEVKKSIVFGILLFLLGLTALAPPAVLYIGSHDDGHSSKLESFILDYQGTIASIGTLLLISSLAILQVYLSNVSAEWRERVNRKTQVEIKLAEFRQIWVNDLRTDTSELVSIAYGAIGAKNIDRMQFLNTRILLRLDPNQRDTIQTATALANLIKAVKENKDDLPSATTQLQLHMAQLLDAEWEKMKEELAAAQRLTGL